MIHVGILGGGNISETHARAAGETAGARVAAVYGENRERAARLARDYGGTLYDSLDAFLAHEPLDVVLVGSPSGLHAEQGAAAARRGLHVLVEKPIDITPARADLLIEECARAGVKLGVFFQDRVAPGVVRLKELVEAGALGRPILASGRVKWYRPPEYYGGSRWRGTWALDGGGALMNQGVHTVDLLLWLLGDVERVYAKAATALHRIEVEDTLVATLEFRSGALGTLEAATSVYPGYRRRVELTGTEGTLVLEHDRIVVADLRNPPADLNATTEESGNASAASPVVSDVSGHRRILEDFLRAIADDTPPRCDGREGRRSVELVEAVYQSSRTGRPVDLKQGEKDKGSGRKG
ncbi:MAG TPA: Gfo/Idh/MocA family oxidoreductase [Pyrinomonadaceae bacterium]